MDSRLSVSMWEHRQQQGWLGSIRPRSFSGRTFFTSITNCASTQIKLFSGDLITQHDREFDQEPTSGCCLGDCLWIFLRKPLIACFQPRIESGGTLCGLSHLKTEQRRAGLADRPEPPLIGTRLFYRVIPGEPCYALRTFFEAGDIADRMNKRQCC